MARIGQGQVCILICAAPLCLAARAVAAPPVRQDPAASADIIVRASRAPGSAILDVDPIFVLDQDMIRSLAANNLRELMERLAPLSTSTGGADPVTLLNGRRISSFNEVDNLPPEAIERTEILPEQEAARFGFPPTVRVVNLVTRKHYRGGFAQELGGTTTEGDGGTNYVELNATRIEGPHRLSLDASYLREDPVRESQRGIVPDPSNLFSIGGNVGGIGGASIAPELDALAGRAVIVAPVPPDPTRRQSLSPYVDGANTPTISDMGRFRSLQERRDTLHINGTLAAPIGRRVDASINLSADSVVGRRMNGLASALLMVPAGNAAFPFAGDVLLYRALDGVILRQRNSSVTLHGGTTLQGGFGQWAWNATSSYDRLRARSRALQGLQLEAFQAGIDAGGDPLALVGPAQAPWLIDRGRTVTQTWVNKAVLQGPVAHLPAGDARLTLSVDHARSTSSERDGGASGASSAFARTIEGASASVIVPVASPEGGGLHRIGSLSLTGTLGVAAVSHYGRLALVSYGANWKPAARVQLSASLDDTRAAPDIALLTSPQILTPNAAFFDFSTGRSLLVTALSGGNPDLAPEHRRVTKAGIDVTPFRTRDIRLDVNYIDTRIDNQSIALASATAAFQAAFPARFVRDEDGLLTRVDLRPVNIAREQERKVRSVLSFSTPLGRAPDSTGKPPPAHPRINVLVAATWRFQDRVRLHPGGPALDLLDGATLTGTGGRPRWEVHSTVSGTAGPLNFGALTRIWGPTRIAGGSPSSDLHFSGRTWIVPYASLDLGQRIHRPWARSATLELTIENLLNSRVEVRDGNGATPYRFQSPFLDPLGRSIRLGLRKAF